MSKKTDTGFCLIFSGLLLYTQHGGKVQPVSVSTCTDKYRGQNDAVSYQYTTELNKPPENGSISCKFH